MVARETLTDDTMPCCLRPALQRPACVRRAEYIARAQRGVWLPLHPAYDPGGLELVTHTSGMRMTTLQIVVLLRGNSTSSEQFYAGRLYSEPQCNRQCVEDGPVVGGAGLRWLDVLHEGNSNSSEEEAEEIRRLNNVLLGRSWTDHDGNRVPLGLDDLLVVAPYNAQVRLLTERLPVGARVGTVDKFQGQEAPVVLVSLASSSANDAPRGMQFLYSRNRLNVAVSRAKALCVMVGSPKLLSVRCRTLEQMRLANVLSRYVEMAGPVGPGSYRERRRQTGRGSAEGMA